MRAAFAAFLLLVLSASLASAEVSLKVNNTDYYFNIGEDAVIPLTVNNTGESLTGTLTYSLEQSVNTGSFQYSSFNSRTVPFNVQKGVKVIPLNFGSSNAESTLTATLTFAYEEGGVEKEARLPSFKIHFTSKASKVKGKPLTSSTSVKKQGSQAQKRQGQSAASRKVQNNQLSQDTSALKREIAEQRRKMEALEKRFEKNLESNPEFQRMVEELKSKGYSLKEKRLNPSTNTSGSFTYNYQDKAGRVKELSGSLYNNTLNASVKTPLSFEKQREELKREDERGSSWPVFAVALIAGVLLLALHHLRKSESSPEPVIEEREEDASYKDEALKLLRRAEKIYRRNEQEAFACLSRAVRVYLSGREGLNKELTSVEALKLLKGREWEEFFLAADAAEFGRVKQGVRVFQECLRIAKRFVK